MQALGHLRPGLAEVARAIHVRPIVFAAMPVHGRIGYRRVEVGSLNLRDLAEGREARGRYVPPGLAGVARQVDQARIAAHPDHARTQGRRGDGVDYAVAELARIVGSYRSRRGRGLVFASVAGQV